MRTFLIALCILCLAPLAHAQSTNFFEALTLSVTPDFPAGNESVQATVRSTSLDLDRATITWYANDERVADGGGLTSATISLGGVGSATRIRAVAETLSGDTYTAERTIRPAEVDLLWEAASYAPPLYRGKRLVSSSSEVRAQAAPRLVRADGSAIPPGDIVFTWRRNGALVSSLSGRGKARAVFPAPTLFGTDTIQVEASSLDGTLIARTSAVIPSSNPQLVLYQYHPLFGTLYHQALSEQATISDVEATFSATPYFAPVHIPTDRSLEYSWRVNGAAIATDVTNPHQVTLNAQNSTGAARIELTLTDTSDIFLEARGRWNVRLNSGYGSTSQDPFQGGAFFPGTQ